MGLTIISTTISRLTTTKNSLILRQILLGQQKTLKYLRGCGEINSINEKMQRDCDKRRHQVSEDASSEEYQEMRNDIEEIENQCKIATLNIQSKMKEAESAMDTSLEMVKTQLQVVEEEIKEWKEARKDKIEKTFRYFST